jgi:radical SAM protein with 4Fe4S-binding SPASM domain
VYNNILTLLEIKKRRKLFKPRVLLVNIDVTDNQERNIYSLNKLKELFGDYKYRAEFLNLELHTWAGEFARRAKKNPFFKMFPMSSNEGGEYFPCPHLFGSFNITWNGDVVPCCRDLRKEYIIGNIREHSIMELWNSKQLVQLREKHRLKQFDDIHLCRGCTKLLADYRMIKIAKDTIEKFPYVIFGHSFK